MYTLGINAAFHDSAACLVRDGHVVAAAEEERFSRIKHGKRPVPFSTWELPFAAIEWCLRTADIGLGDVDRVAYSFDPEPLLRALPQRDVLTLPLEPSAAPVDERWLTAWEPLFAASIVNAPRQLRGGAPHHLRARFALDAGAAPEWRFVPHHLAHAASAFLPSPFEAAAVLTLDGRGERATTSYSLGQGGQLELLGQVEVPHSLGLLYERVTTHLGFLHSSDEYKVMALASYGRPRWADALRSGIRVGEQGDYRIDLPPLEELFGPARARGAALEERHFDAARSLQLVLEETVLDLCRWLQRVTGARDLCMAGGVALNCVMNARVRDAGPFERVWVQPAAGDAGTALGAALLVDARERGERSAWRMESAALGPEFGDAEIEAALRWAKLPWRRTARLADEVAALLGEGRIVGWFQGRMEFGPRALGQRSILASPIPPDMQERMNDIKEREDFRPVAPAVLEERAPEWFETAGASPFMLFTCRVRPERRERVPAITHVDGTARVQTVRRDQNPAYYDLLAAFERRTGVPVLVNTSFNSRGQPIVCSPQDAIETFWSTPLDVLAIGPFLVEKP